MLHLGRPGGAYILDSGHHPKLQLFVIIRIRSVYLHFCRRIV
jgi:hypothetical protein